MNRTAIERARARLERTEAALADLKAAKSYPKAEAAWTDFLLATGAIYSQLEQGSKGCPRCTPWFGEKKHQRKCDPVLRYVHFARNAEEHGIEFVTERHPDGGQRQTFGEKTEWIIQQIDEKTFRPIGEKVHGWMYGPHIKLARANDRRFNDYCDPPLIGPGKPHRDPVELGATALERFREIIREAETLP